MSTLSVRVHGAEFSRYYPPLDIIKVTASTDAGAVLVTFTLIREDGYGVVATKTATVSGTTANVSFDLKSDGKDADGIFRTRQGKYHIHATLPDLTAADSTAFDIMIVSVAEFKAKYLRGVDLTAANVLEPQNFPFPSLPGVDIVNAAATQFKGIFTLAWGGTASPTLTWDGGTPYTVDMTKSTVSTPLINSKRNAYIEVVVVPDDLPVGAVVENVILDEAEIEDDTLRSFLLDAYQDIQGRIFVAIEPTSYDTERVGDTSYDSAVFTDEYADPLTYYRDVYFPSDKFLTVRFPHPWIFHNGIKRLEFMFNSTKVATINVSDWLVNMQKSNSGLVEFVPKIAATLIFAWFSTAGLAFLTRWPTIPSAWHYRLTAGLPDLMNEGRDRVRVAVARKAAIEALVLAGLASTGGLTSESTSKDGVSQSRSYSSGPGGQYSQIVLQHQVFLFGPNGNGGEILRLRQKLLGLYGVTI